MKLDRVLLLSIAALAIPAAGHAEMPQAARQQAAKPQSAKPQAAKPRSTKPQAARPQSAQSTAGRETASAAGPRVHVSKSRDITDCTARTQGGPRSVAGLGLGALAGSKVGGGATGVLVGGAAAGAVGEAMDRKARCGPSAQVESNAAPEEAPKKKRKLSLGRILGQ
ncbi:hypothetical protein TPR58_09410 [Sphingomonas sp. HF-S3]|uniref:Glycine zipper domain-containing protein n=1 Tax=Sphingomonas rustica TaxID=3103142 RepID=A0ABV0B9Y1_9SPHN